MSKRSSNVKIRNYQSTIAAQARAAREKAANKRPLSQVAADAPPAPIPGSARPYKYSRAQKIPAQQPTTEATANLAAERTRLLSEMERARAAVLKAAAEKRSE